MTYGNFISFRPDPVLGKQIKWIKCKDMPNQCIHILEIREIDEVKFAVLSERKFHDVKNHEWVDIVLQKELYTSDEDLKKFEMYNE